MLGLPRQQRHVTALCNVSSCGQMSRGENGAQLRQVRLRSSSTQTLSGLIPEQQVVKTQLQALRASLDEDADSTSWIRQVTF